jgi:hypothetical protein
MGVRSIGIGRHCPNGVTVRHTTLESAFFRQLQTAVLTTDVIQYLVTKLLKAQHTKGLADEHEKRIRDLEAEIKRIVAAIAAVGHSDALVFNLKSRESEMRELSAAKQTQRTLSAEEIRAFVSKPRSGYSRTACEVTANGQS